MTSVDLPAPASHVIISKESADQVNERLARDRADASSARRAPAELRRERLIAAIKDFTVDDETAHEDVTDDTLLDSLMRELRGVDYRAAYLTALALQGLLSSTATASNDGTTELAEAASDYFSEDFLYGSRSDGDRMMERRSVLMGDVVHIFETSVDGWPGGTSIDGPTIALDAWGRVCTELADAVRAVEEESMPIVVYRANKREVGHPDHPHYDVTRPIASGRAELVPDDAVADPGIWSVLPPVYLSTHIEEFLMQFIELAEADNKFAARFFAQCRDPRGLLLRLDITDISPPSLGGEFCTFCDAPAFSLLGQTYRCLTHHTIDNPSAAVSDGRPGLDGLPGFNIEKNDVVEGAPDLRALIEVEIKRLHLAAGDAATGEGAFSDGQLAAYGDAATTLRKIIGKPSCEAPHLDPNESRDVLDVVAPPIKYSIADSTTWNPCSTCGQTSVGSSAALLQVDTQPGVKKHDHYGKPIYFCEKHAPQVGPPPALKGLVDFVTDAIEEEGGK